MFSHSPLANAFQLADDFILVRTFFLFLPVSVSQRAGDCILVGTFTNGGIFHKKVRRTAEVTQNVLPFRVAFFQHSFGVCCDGPQLMDYQRDEWWSAVIYFGPSLQMSRFCYCD